MLKIIFWIIVFIILYTYFGYPIFVYLLSLFINNKVKKKNIEPKVTLLITAHNEEKKIRKKLENTLELDYPKDKLEVIVASDGSNDMTDKIVQEFRDKRVILFKTGNRVGKTEAQNKAVQIATGDIIIFSDADSMYDKSAIRRIVQNFYDTKVGVVSGRCEYVDPNGAPVGLATKVYWKYEIFIKGRQTKINTLTGATGCIYSVRKDLYTPLSKEIISDLIEPLMVLQKGYRIVFEPEAIAYEKAAEKVREELKMRIRVISRAMNGFISVKNLFNPFRYPFVAFQLVSHKVLRWLMPLLILALFIVNIPLLGKRFYNWIFIIQVVFYSLAFIGWRLDLANKKIKVFALPLYFCTVNLASLVSLWKILTGEVKAVWEPARK